MKTRVKRYACGAAILSALCLSATGACANDSNNTYGIGIEGFHDSFDGRFPDLSGSDYTEKTDEGSVTGYFVHNWRGFFAALDGRASYGTADFNSSLFGSASGMQQFEFELRARFGKTYSLWGGAISPYVGLGVLYHEDEAKGYYTNGGTDGEAGLYDRDVTQLYIPIGASFSFATDGGWSITPQAEGDVLFYGDADSRFTNTPILTDQGAFQAANFNTNTQNFGLGGRGELMLGKNMGDYTVQFGPFIRYWSVNGSDKQQYTILTGTGTVNLSYPSNTRTQVGAALRILW